MQDAVPQRPPAAELLEAKLEEASAEASSMRKAAESSPPSVADLGEVAPRAGLVDLFLTDVGEALRQVCVAGLSFPNPELPESLQQLAERARQHRLPLAFESLSRLRLFIAAVLAEPSLEARHVSAGKAFQETQRLIAWHRLFRSEHDLLTVQSRMAAEATGQEEKRPEAFRTRDVSVWPLGVDLSSGGKLVLYCRALEGDDDVLLADHLAEFDADNPFRGGCISRLFQDVVELPRVLGSVIRLESHPYVDRGAYVLFRPAFRATPKLLAVADDFRPPRLGAFAHHEGGALPQRPVELRVQLTRPGGHLQAHYGLHGTLLPLSPLLRFNLSKLLLREASRSLPLDLVVVAEQDRIRVLSATTELDGRVFVGHDPTLFALAPALVQSRADHGVIEGEPVAKAFLRVASTALGGSPPARLDAIRQELAALSPRGLEEHYRLGLAAALVGMKLDPAKVAPILDDTLSLLAQPPHDPVDLEKLGRVLGRRSGEVSSGDLRHLAGEAAYRAIWLSMQAGRVAEVQPLLLAVFESRFAGELRAPSVADICARALLVVLSGEEVPDETSTDGAPDEDRAENGRYVEALGFLRAHLETISPKTPTTKTRPLPEPIELLQLGDTLAFLSGEPRLGPVLQALALPEGKLRQLVVDALYAWLVEGEGPSSAAVALHAADAMLAATFAELSRYLFA